MKIYLFRHGETDWNKVLRCQGHIMDPPIHLNDKGRDQARETAKILRDKNLDVIFSSDLHRALDTAEIIANVYDIEIIQDERLRETNFGDLQGTIYDGESDKYFKDGSLSFPGGESLNEAKQRVQDFLMEMISTYDYENVGIASHGGVIGNLKSSLIGEPYKHVENGEILSIDYDEEIKEFRII